MISDEDRAALDRMMQERGITGDSAALRYFSLGTGLMLDEKYREAVTAYTACLWESPGFALALFERGCVLHDQGDLEGALKDYLACLDPSVLTGLNGHDEDPYYNAATTCHDLGRADEALALAEKSVEWNPDWGENWLFLAELHEKRGDVEGAKSILKRALQQDFQEHLHPHIPLEYLARAKIERELRSIEAGSG